MKNSNSCESLLRRPRLLEELDAEFAGRSLREFVVQAWHVVEPSTPFVPGWHIDAIVEHLEAVSRGQIRNLLINVPPRHMKSLLVAVFWPAWEWIRSPERRWLYSSYGAQLSIRDSVKCRRLIESPYQQRWANRFALTSDQNTKGRFDNNRSGYRLSTSVGGAATGEGGDRIVCDDPHNVQEAESDAVRKGTIEWFDVVMSTRLNDPKTAAKVVVMQRCHQQDLSGHLLEQGGWEHLCLPAEYEEPRTTSIGWSDPRTKHGELLWSERFGAKEIESLKRSLGSYGAAGQLQQRPSPAGGGLFKRHWWRYYQRRGANLPPIIVRLPDGTQTSIQAVEAPHRVDEMVQSWDCAFKDLATSDYVVGQAWARIGGMFLLGEQVRARMDCPATIKAVRDLSAKWPLAVAKLVEDKANGTAVIQMLGRDLPGLVPVSPEGGKVARAAAVSPLIEAGNVFLPHPQSAPWVDDFIEECAAFPNGAHDDQSTR
jgi:predicted phage terminase large subunit-like protein